MLRREARHLHLEPFRFADDGILLKLLGPAYLPQLFVWLLRSWVCCLESSLDDQPGAELALGELQTRVPEGLH
jgi:hypothetical protein